MHREFTTGKLTPRPLDFDWSRQITWPGYCSLIGRAASSSMIKCMQTALYLSRRVFHRLKLASWFLYKFPNFDAEIVSKCKEIQRQRGEKSGRGQTCEEIKKSVKAVVYVVFSQNLWRNSEFLWVCPIEDIWPTVKSLSYPHDQRLGEWKIFFSSS